MPWAVQAAFFSGGGDLVYGGFVKEVNGFHKSFQGREGDGNFFLKVCDDPLGGEKDRAGESWTPEGWEDFFALKGNFVRNNSILDGDGPRDDVVEPPAAVREVVLKTVNMPFVDRATEH